MVRTLTERYIFRHRHQAMNSFKETVRRRVAPPLSSLSPACAKLRTVPWGPFVRRGSRALDEQTYEDALRTFPWGLLAARRKDPELVALHAALVWWAELWDPGFARWNRAVPRRFRQWRPM